MKIVTRKNTNNPIKLIKKFKYLSFHFENSIKLFPKDI